MTPTTWPAWLDSLASTGHLHRLGWVVLHSLWQAAAVAAVLAVALRLLPRRTAFGQEARYLLATLALFSLPVACGVTWTLVEPSRQPLRAVADRGQQPGPTLVIPAAVAGSLDRGHIARASTALPAAPAAEPTASLSTSDAIRILAARAAAVAEPWLPTCAAVWLTGVLVAALRLVVGWSLTRRLVATAAPLPDASWQTRLARWTSALGIAAPIRLLASARVDVPIVVGWLRPVVIWPVAAVTGMPPEQIDAILAHELAHVRRHDVLVNLVQSVIEAVFFHHPAAWWISAQVRAEREHCADELAIRALAAGKAGSRISYATALLSLEERRQAILVAAANGGSLGDRIRRLVGVEQQSGHPARLAAAVVVLVAVVATLAAPPGGPSRQAMAANAENGEPAVPVAPGSTDELPEDTNKIESLTPEQAKRLVTKFKGQVLPLPGLTRLDVDTARALAEFKGQVLHIPGLEKLDSATAHVLLNSKWDRQLKKLASLDAETARTLAAAKVPWSFPDLTTLDAETAKALVRGKGVQLLFDGLTTLDAATARELAKFEGDILSLGLTRLEPAVARELAKFQGSTLWLKSLETISDESAEELSTFNRRHLGLWNLATLSNTAIKSLATCGCKWLALGLASLPKERAALLANFDGDSLWLNGLSALDPDAAQALAAFKGKELSLRGLTSLDAATAQALVAFEGKRLSIGLTTLDAATAKALATFKGEEQHLGGLTNIDAATAEALDGFRGNFHFSVAINRACLALQRIAPADARLVVLAAHTDNVHGMKLEQVTALDDPKALEVAQILATARGQLALPNLEKISPKTLTALLKKKDVQLPLIETLELIPEG